MQKFYFNVHDDAVIIDDHGTQLPDAQAAKQQAILYARAMVWEDALQGEICLAHRIEVEDENRRPVLTLPFSAAVAIRS